MFPLMNIVNHVYMVNATAIRPGAKNEMRSEKVSLIRKGGVVLAPHVTDMRNGLFRAEVAYSKGKATDVFVGEVYGNRLRAQITAEVAASAALMTAAGVESVWREVARALADCQALVVLLQDAIC